jgi:hypothetical protein
VGGIHPALTTALLHFSLADNDMLVSVLGCGFFMAFTGMFGFCVGVLLRRTTAAVATFFGIVFVVWASSRT